MVRICTLFVFFFVIGCSPKTQLPGNVLQPISFTENALHTKDGKALPLHHWESDPEDEKAIIIALHGFNDYKNAFAFPGSWWMQRGVTTYAYDQRGFGQGEQIGIWAPKELLIDDLAAMIQVVKMRKPGKPIYLLGESMGGAVVMAAMATPDFPKVDGVILSAPAVWGWKSLNFFYRSLMWLTAHLVPTMKPSGSDLRIQASDNIPMLRNLGHDPLFIKKTRVDAVYGLVGLMDKAYDSADVLTMPTLLLYGANDQVIPKKPVENVVERIPKTADIVLYKDGWHLLLRDLQAPVVWQDILSWIEEGEIPSGNKVIELPLFKPSVHSVR